MALQTMNIDLDSSAIDRMRKYRGPRFNTYWVQTQTFSDLYYTTGVGSFIISNIGLHSI